MKRQLSSSRATTRRRALELGGVLERRSPLARPATRGGAAQQDVARGAVGAGAVEAVLDHVPRRRARQRLALLGGVVRAARDERARERLAVAPLARGSIEVAGLVVDRSHARRSCPVSRVGSQAVCPARCLCSCGGKRQRVRRATASAHGRRAADPRAPARDALGVVDQLLGVHLEPRRSTPTTRASPRAGGSRAAAPAASAAAGSASVSAASSGSPSSSACDAAGAARPVLRTSAGSLGRAGRTDSIGSAECPRSASARRSSSQSRSSRWRRSRPGCSARSRRGSRGRRRRAAASSQSRRRRSSRRRR